MGLFLRRGCASLAASCPHVEIAPVNPDIVACPEAHFGCFGLPRQIASPRSPPTRPRHWSLAIHGNISVPRHQRDYKRNVVLRPIPRPHAPKQPDHRPRHHLNLPSRKAGVKVSVSSISADCGLTAVSRQPVISRRVSSIAGIASSRVTHVPTGLRIHPHQPEFQRGWRNPVARPELPVRPVAHRPDAEVGSCSIKRRRSTCAILLTDSCRGPSFPKARAAKG